MGTYRIILNHIKKNSKKRLGKKKEERRKKEDESSIKSRLNKRQALEATKNFYILKCKIQNVRVQQHNLCVSTCGTFFETYKIKLSFILTPPVQRDRDADTVEKWSRFRSWLWSTGKKIWSLFLLLPSLLFKGSHSSLGNLSIQLFYALYMCHPFKLLEEDRDFNETKGIFFQVEVWGYGLPNVKLNIFCSKKPNSQFFNTFCYLW